MPKLKDCGMKQTEKEIWADVPGFGGHYRVSTKGRVIVKRRAVTRMGRHGKLVTYNYRARLLRPTNSNGYKSVHIGVNGTKYTALVHHLVLAAFLGPKPKGQFGCHNDGNPMNNCLSNLRWDTHKGNMADRKAHGMYPSGEDHPMAKFSNETRQKISQMNLQQALAFGVSKTHFYRLKRQIQWGPHDSVEALGHRGFYRVHGIDLMAEAERLARE